MSKIIAVIIGVLVLGTGAVFLFTSGDDSEVVTNESQEQIAVSDESIEQPKSSHENAKTASGGNYIEYTAENLNNAEGQRVVFFHAEWCSVCNRFEGQIEDQGVPSGITIIKADYDEETDLKSKYGVNVQSTFVLLDESGEVVKVWPFASGLSDVNDLYRQIEEA